MTCSAGFTIYPWSLGLFIPHYLLATQQCICCHLVLTPQHSQLQLLSQVPILLLGVKYVQWERNYTSLNLATLAGYSIRVTRLQGQHCVTELTPHLYKRVECHPRVVFCFSAITISET